MEFQPQLILVYLTPLFALFIAAELYMLRKRADVVPGSAQYSWKDSISNGFLALFHEIGEVTAALVVISIYYSLFGFRLFERFGSLGQAHHRRLALGRSDSHAFQ